jgi:hypothetical protein
MFVQIVKFSLDKGENSSAIPCIRFVCRCSYLLIFEHLLTKTYELSWLEKIFP